MIYIFCMLAGVIFFCFGYMVRVALEEHEDNDFEPPKYDETEKPNKLEPVPVEKKERKEEDDDVYINYFYQ